MNSEDVDKNFNPEKYRRHKDFPLLKDKYGTPRLVVGQLDSIRITCVLRPLVKPLLRVLTTWIAERKYDSWLTIFYASFIFLREIALATYDAYEHGRRNIDNQHIVSAANCSSLGTTCRY